MYFCYIREAAHSTVLRLSMNGSIRLSSDPSTRLAPITQKTYFENFLFHGERAGDVAVVARVLHDVPRQRHQETRYERPRYLQVPLDLLEHRLIFYGYKIDKILV